MTKAKQFFRFFKYTVWLLCIWMSLSGLLAANKKSQIYNYPLAEIIAHIGDSSLLWSTSENVLNFYRYNLFVLNGCEELGVLNLDQSGNISLSEKSIYGNVKILLLDDDKNVHIYEPSTKDEQIIAIDSGTYRIIAIGRWYCGSITIS